MPEYADSNEYLKKLRDLIKEDLESVEGPRSRLVRRIKVRKQLYESELPKRQYKGRANVRVPFPYTWVESMVPRYMASIFVGRDVLDVLPRHLTTPDKAMAAKTLVNYQLLFEADFFWESYAFFKTVCVKGVAICKVRWNEQKQCPEIIQILPEDFAVDPRSPTPEKSEWLAQKTYMTKDELVAGADASAVDLASGLDPEAVLAMLQSTQPQVSFGEGNQNVTVPKARGLYEVWEWWGKADIGEGPERLVCLFAGTHLLSARKSPYGDLVPFVALADVPDPYRFCDARSELDSIESLYEAASDIVNQRLDNVTQSINGLTTVRKGSGIDVNKLISVPWGAIEVEDHSDLKVWDSKNVTADAYKEVASMLEFCKMATGLQDYQRGVESPSIDTATGASKLFEAANMRPGLKVKMMQFRYLKRIGEIFLIEDQMFMSEMKQALILGQDMKRYEPRAIHPAHIQGLFNIQPVGFDLAGNRDQRINQMISLTNIIQATQPTSPAWPLVEEIVQMAELKSGDRILLAAQAQAQAQIQAQKMAAMQPPQGPNRMTGAPVGQPGVVNNPNTPPSGQGTPMGPPAGANLRQ